MRLNRLLLLVGATVSCAKHVAPPAPAQTPEEYDAYSNTLSHRGPEWSLEFPLDPKAVPGATALTLIVDGRPLPYHGVVIAHRTIPDTGLAGPFTRYKRTLFLWPDGGGGRLIMVRGSMFDEPVITPAEFPQDWCVRLMSHACAPHVIQYADSVIEGFAINGHVSIEPAMKRARCGNTLSEHRFPASEAACNRAVYHSSLDVILADSGGVLDTYSAWTGNMGYPVQHLMYGNFSEHLVLPPTAIGGLEFTATCRAGVSPQWVCGDSLDRVAYAQERGTSASAPTFCGQRRCALMVDASPASSFRTLRVYGGTPPSATTMTVTTIVPGHGTIDSTPSRLQLRGLVQDNAGDPISGATVYVKGRGTNAQTDSMGGVTLVFPPNTVSGSRDTLIVFAAGYLERRWPFTIGQDSVLPLPLEQDWRVGNFAQFDPRSHPRAFYGVVKSSDGNPVAGATIWTNGVGTQADSLGRYVLILPSASKIGARYALNVRQIGFRMSTRNVVVRPTAVRSDFILRQSPNCDIGCDAIIVRPAEKSDSMRKKPHPMD